MNTSLSELAKAVQSSYQTAGNAPIELGVEKSPEVRMKTFARSPFLSVLETKNRSFNSSTANVMFFEEDPHNTAEFIGETDNIPDFKETDYTPKSDYMRTIATGISISYMAEMGIDAINLREREINRAYINVNNKIDYNLLNGDATSNPLEFNKVLDDTNTVDNNGESVTESIIDDILETIVMDNDGTPDILLTDMFVAKQLKAIAAPYRRWNDKVDIGLGHRVTTYESVDGLEIPVLIDPNLKSTEDNHRIEFVDSTAIEIKYLLRPSVFLDLAHSNLANNMAVASFVTARNIAPETCGSVTGIGSD